MASNGPFFGVSALLFGASVAATTAWCASMQPMSGMRMPGGWTMSMTWMRMPGSSWPGSAASFIVMWTVMMIAMMLPSLVPTLLRYRATVARRGGARIELLTAVNGAGYFLVWIAAGAAVFAIGVTLAAIEMRDATLSRAVPVAGGSTILIAGLLQFTRWKRQRLSICRGGGDEAGPPTVRNAMRRGICAGLRCVYCCANLTAILLVAGVMDLRAMAVVTAAITAERISRSGQRMARLSGALIVAAGTVLLLRGGI